MEVVNTKLQETTNPKIEIEHWAPVSIWTWSVSNDDCKICNQKITSKCAECFSAKFIKDKECTVSKGTCSHGFHNHCIRKWLNEGPNTCPLCRIPWTFNKEDLNEKGTLFDHVKKRNT